MARASSAALSPQCRYNGSHLVDTFDRERPVFVVEGEPATDALLEIGCQALGTVTGASSCPVVGSACRSHRPPCRALA